MNTTTPFYAKLAHICVAILALGYIAILGKSVLAPLVMALLFSMLLLPLAGFLERRLRFNRALSSAAVVVLLIASVSGIMIVLVSQLTDFAKDIPAFQQQFLKSMESVQTWIAATFHVDNKAQVDYVTNSASHAVGEGTVFVGTTLLSLSTSLLFLIFTFLYTFFLLLHRKLLLRFVVALFHEKHTSVVFEIVARVQYIIRKYIAGLFLQMLIVMVLTFTAFLILGVHYAFLLAMLTGILNVIPYVGIFTSLLISVLVTFATSNSGNVVLVLITMVSIHLIDSNFIMPKIVGSKVKLNTLSALLGLFVGEMIWGITGMFLSIPIIAIAKVIFDRVEGLKPWGMVLGEDESTEETADLPPEEAAN